MKNTSTSTYTGEGASARLFVFGFNLRRRPFGQPSVYVAACRNTWSPRRTLLLSNEAFDIPSLAPSRLARAVRSIRTYWARCFFPTTMTLGMTATQRVEGIFSAVKHGRNLKRSSTFRQVRQRVEEVAEDLALASRMQVTQRPHRVFAPLLVWCGTAHGVSVVSYQPRAGTML